MTQDERFTIGAQELEFRLVHKIGGMVVIACGTVASAAIFGALCGLAFRVARFVATF